MEDSFRVEVEKDPPPYEEVVGNPQKYPLIEWMPVNILFLFVQFRHLSLLSPDLFISCFNISNIKIQRIWKKYCFVNTSVLFYKYGIIHFLWKIVFENRKILFLVILINSVWKLL